MCCFEGKGGEVAREWSLDWKIPGLMGEILTWSFILLSIWSIHIDVAFTKESGPAGLITVLTG